MRRWWGPRCRELGLDAYAIAVLATMDDLSRGTGRCWATVGTIAERAGMSETKARRVIHALRDRGILEPDGDPSGGRSATTYEIREPCTVARVGVPASPESPTPTLSGAQGSTLSTRPPTLSSSPATLSAGQPSSKEARRTSSSSSPLRGEESSEGTPTGFPVEHLRAQPPAERVAMLVRCGIDDARRNRCRLRWARDAFLPDDERVWILLAAGFLDANCTLPDRLARRLGRKPAGDNAFHRPWGLFQWWLAKASSLELHRDATGRTSRRGRVLQISAWWGRAGSRGHESEFRDASQAVQRLTEEARLRLERLALQWLRAHDLAEPDPGPPDGSRTSSRDEPGAPARVLQLDDARRNREEAP